MDTLSTVSDELSALVEGAGPAIVRVEARRRFPASGIVWSADGLIVTAEHAVERDEDIRVGLSDGQIVEATLVGRDPTTDSAVLRAQAARLTPPVWAEPSGARVGQLVLALARPGRTVRASVGIISAFGESWRTPAGGEIDRYLQTDAGMAPGFSGGLLVSASGQALGMNTVGLVRWGPGGGRRRGAITVPVPTLRRVVDALVTHGRIRRGYLGVGAHPVRLPQPLREPLDQRWGLMVISIESGSPAERAGVVLGDVLIAIDGTPVRRHEDIAARLDAATIGKPIAVKILRAGNPMDVTVTVGERP